MKSNNEKLNNQYKPGPGEPYRPVLAAPPRLKHLQSGWSKCELTADFFQGLDPPRALTAKPLLTPQPTIPAKGDLVESARPAHGPLPPGPTATKSISASAAKSEESAPAPLGPQKSKDPGKKVENVNPGSLDKSTGMASESRATEAWNSDNEDPPILASIGSAVYNAFGFHTPKGGARPLFGASSPLELDQADSNAPSAASPTPAAKAQGPDGSNNAADRQHASFAPLNEGSNQHLDPSNTSPSNAIPNPVGNPAKLPPSETPATRALTSNGRAPAFTFKGTASAAPITNANHDAGIGSDPMSSAFSATAGASDSTNIGIGSGASGGVGAGPAGSGGVIVSDASSDSMASSNYPTTSPSGPVSYSEAADSIVAQMTLTESANRTGAPFSEGGNTGGSGSGNASSSPINYNSDSEAASWRGKFGFRESALVICILGSVMMHFG